MHSYRDQWLLSALCFALLAGTGCSTQAADTPAGPPATVAEAARVLDLSSLPLAAGAELPQRRTIAGVSYDAPGDVAAIFESQRKQLVGQGWRELPGGYVSPQSATVVLNRSGFTISLMVIPSTKAGRVNVMWMNHGNVKLEKLPVPPDAKLFFAGPVSAMYVAESPRDVTAEVCRKLLLANGWLPYGAAGDSLVFKQNAIRLTATVASAPAQGGKTMITYSTELMSADLPVPADATGVQYSDTPIQLFFDIKLPQADVAAFYRSAMAKAGWEATTEKPFQIDFKNEMIFRNPAHDMLTLTLQDVSGITRVLLRFQTAAEIAEIERLIKAEAQRKKNK